MTAAVMVAAAGLAATVPSAPAGAAPDTPAASPPAASGGGAKKADGGARKPAKTNASPSPSTAASQAGAASASAAGSAAGSGGAAAGGNGAAGANGAAGGNGSAGADGAAAGNGTAKADGAAGANAAGANAAGANAAGANAASAGAAAAANTAAANGAVGAAAADPGGVGAAAAATARVRGRAWNDSNRDGIRSAGERGIRGLPVLVVSAGELSAASDADLAQQLRDHLRRRQAGASAAAGIDLREAVTGADGTYDVPAVAAGTVVVAIGTGPVDPDGDISSVQWAFSRYARGSDRSRDSDFVPVADPGQPVTAGISAAVTAAGGTTVVLDAGMYRRPILAVTGANVAVMTLTGGLLLVAGLLLVRLGRRRVTAVA
ncbi:hypothetical protein KZZ52_40140 [Dactylosporangium sp. AC04546]|uniref:hypothetical protein n=1 Tax=Dactylosporangium sp. AC04546 TaxID=2862460 RepID=UPI001EDD4509|nr:hypothetical protein [Dactylosporangium sp. AC04546]WVK80158.1 hypothetical protein KZZ52_40140 [Dactylosporangium sp. AC04546]